MACVAQIQTLTHHSETGPQDPCRADETANVRAVKFTAAEVARATDGTVAEPDATTDIDGATQDSRAIWSGQLFVPLVAERDGHDFISNAVRAGAAAYLTHHDVDANSDGVAIHVPDTTTALRKLGRAARDKLSGPVVGITGSVGKTSTKDLLESALRTAGPTWASAKSFNNEIGVPLTLVNAPDDTQYTVVEMGARGIGHISLLCDIAAPTVGVVTTVAAAHTSEFGTVENIALAKSELVEALPAEGLAVLNGDNPLVSGMRSRTDATVITFGHDVANDVRIESVALDDELRATFELATSWGKITAQPATRGAHMATNVAAAAAAALWLGAEPDAVSLGFAEAQPSPWRMEVAWSPAGALVINDSYNANPTSMRGALASLAGLPHARKVAVVGYMGELGIDEEEAHRQIAGEVLEAGFELLAVGTDLYGVAPTPDPATHLDGVGPETAILVKGSRSAGLEKVAAALLSDSSSDG